MTTLQGPLLLQWQKEWSNYRLKPPLLVVTPLMRFSKAYTHLLHFLSDSLLFFLFFSFLFSFLFWPPSLWLLLLVGSRLFFIDLFFFLFIKILVVRYISFNVFVSRSEIRTRRYSPHSCFNTYILRRYSVNGTHQLLTVLRRKCEKSVRSLLVVLRGNATSSK